MITLRGHCVQGEGRKGKGVYAGPCGSKRAAWVSFYARFFTPGTGGYSQTLQTSQPLAHSKLIPSESPSNSFYLATSLPTITISSIRDICGTGLDHSGSQHFPRSTRICMRYNSGFSESPPTTTVGYPNTSQGIYIYALTRLNLVRGRGSLPSSVALN